MVWMVSNEVKKGLKSPSTNIDSPSPSPPSPFMHGFASVESKILTSHHMRLNINIYMSCTCEWTYISYFPIWYKTSTLIICQLRHVLGKNNPIYPQ